MAAGEQVIFVDKLLAESRVVSKEAGGGNSSSNPLAIIIEDGDLTSAVIQEDEWLRSQINDGDNLVNSQLQRPKIQKVPGMRREMESNENCYDPLVVSIGPYHHGKPKLERMEKVKITMARQFVKKSPKPYAEFYEKVVRVSGDARNCYAEGSTEDFDKKAFTRMMFLDGCFILQFIYCIVKKKEDMELRDHDVSFVTQDLLLLENQLPFLVLEVLMSLRFTEDEGKTMIINFTKMLIMMISPQEDSSKRWIKNFVSRFIWRSHDISETKERGSKGFEGHPVHLLELFREQIINVYAVEDYGFSRTSVGGFTYRSVKELRRVGIDFRPAKVRSLMEVQVKSSMFSVLVLLSPLVVDESTKSMLSNLVAYETCPDAPNDLFITSYVCFMDSLISDAEDVKELRSKGVILNYLGRDQKVADLFNEMAHGLVPNPTAYVDAKSRIESHYKHSIKVCIAEWLYTHFSSPWTVLTCIAGICAVAAMVPSILQTYYAARTGN